MSFSVEYAGAARWLKSRVDRGDLTDDAATELWNELAAEITSLRTVNGGAHELTIVQWRTRVESVIAETGGLTPR